MPFTQLVEVVGGLVSSDAWRTALPSGVCEICGVEVLENKKSYKQSTK